MSSVVSRALPAVREIEYPQIDTGFLTKSDIKKIIKVHKPQVLDPKSSIVALFLAIVGALVVNFALSTFAKNIPLNSQDKRFLEMVGAAALGSLAIYVSQSAKQTALTRYNLQKNMLRAYQLHEIVEGETLHDILEIGTNALQNDVLNEMNASQFFAVKHRTFLRHGTLAQKVYSRVERSFKTNEKDAIAWQHKFLTSLYTSVVVKNEIPTHFQIHSENVFGVYSYKERITQYFLDKLALDNMRALYAFANSQDFSTLKSACIKLSHSKAAEKMKYPE